MNLAEKLMKMDRGKLTEVQTGEIEIKRLSEITGEPFVVKCKALAGDRYTELTSGILDRKGRTDFTKFYEVNALVAVEGVVEPDLKNVELQKHFGCATPKELAKVIFRGGDMQTVCNLITELSGYGEDTEEEIKN